MIEHDITLGANIANKSIIFNGDPGRNTMASEPMPINYGINNFLASINITMRKDELSGRPYINKINSVKDLEQKSSRNYYDI